MRRKNFTSNEVDGMRAADKDTYFTGGKQNTHKNRAVVSCVNSEGKATMADCPILPSDIVTDILSRLSVKSLCRFKCVSSSWHALISDPCLAKIHNTRNNKKPEKPILIADSDSFALYSVDCYNNIPAATKLDFPSLQVQSKDQWAGILGSCDGFILAHNKADGGRYLLNPSTRESMKLTEPPFPIDEYKVYGLGYDSSTDQYKIVMLSDFVSVYSLKHKCWRIKVSPYVLSTGDLSGVYVNGSLHWLANRVSDYLSVIVAFDLATENFQEVLPPDSVNNDRLSWCNLAVLRGCLCLLVDSPSNIKMNIWMMKVYGVTESWTKFTIKFPYLSTMEVICSLEDDEFLLAMNKKKLVEYCPKEGTKRDMMVRGIPTTFTGGGTYVESVISLGCRRSERRTKEIEALMKRLKQLTLLERILQFTFGINKAKNKDRCSSSRNIEAEADTCTSREEYFNI